MRMCERRASGKWRIVGKGRPLPGSLATSATDARDGKGRVFASLANVACHPAIHGKSRSTPIIMGVRALPVAKPEMEVLHVC